jgi:hypothetical protein
VGAVGGRGAGDVEHESGVVLELAVPRQDAAPDVVAHHAGQGARLGGTDPAWLGQGAAPGAGAEPEQVAGPHAAARQERLDRRHVVGQGNEHRQRVHQVRGGVLHEDAPLHGALVGDADLPLRQVAQPTVDELRAPARRAPGDVEGVDGHHREPARGGVERDAGPGDTQADHEQVGALGDARRARGDAGVVAARSRTCECRGRGHRGALLPLA